MVTAVLLAASMLGAPVVETAFVWLAWHRPLAAAPLVATIWIVSARRRSSRASDPDELALIDVAADLRSGSALRAALASAERMPAEVARLAAAGRPLHEVAAALAASSRPGAQLLAPGLRIVGEAGGSAAPMFEAVAGMLIDDDLVRREIRNATIGPVSQAVLVGGVPVVSVAWTVVSGAFGDAIEQGGVEATLVTVGTTLVAAGLVSVWLVVRRVSRWR